MILLIPCDHYCSHQESRVLANKDDDFSLNCNDQVAFNFCKINAIALRCQSDADNFQSIHFPLKVFSVRTGKKSRRYFAVYTVYITNAMYVPLFKSYLRITNLI